MQNVHNQMWNLKKKVEYVYMYILILKKKKKAKLLKTVIYEW